jgi:hypothetical protein
MPPDYVPPTTSELFPNDVIMSDLALGTSAFRPAWVAITKPWNRLGDSRATVNPFSTREEATEYKFSTSVIAQHFVKYIVGATEPPLFFAPDPSYQLTETSEPSIDDVLDFISSKGVSIRRDDVLDYLLGYQDMIELLPDICSTVVKRFGSDAKFLLKVYSDPEIDHEFLELVIREKRYDHDIIGVIQELQSAYDGEFNKRKGWLVISTDFALI